MDLFANFANLPLAQSTENLSAIALSAERQDFLAKASDGSPVFLLHDTNTANYSPEIELKNIRVQFHCTCRVTTIHGTIEDRFAVISCNPTSPELYEIYVRCFSTVVEQLPAATTTKDLQQCIQAVLDLFRALGVPSSRELIGLWAELFVISKCDNVSHALNAWHRDSLERFDFAWPSGRVEVKATVREQRVHEFSLEQLQPPKIGVGFIVSVLLQSMNGGIGVTELANTIEQRIRFEPKLRQKLWENVAAALGSDFSERLDRRFDSSYAERNLSIFDVNDIPAPEQPRDPRITGLRFKVDISAVQSSLAGKKKDLFHDFFE